MQMLGGRCSCTRSVRSTQPAAAQHSPRVRQPFDLSTSKCKRDALCNWGALPRPSLREMCGAVHDQTCRSARNRQNNNLRRYRGMRGTRGAANTRDLAAAAAPARVSAPGIALCSLGCISFHFETVPPPTSRVPSTHAAEANLPAVSVCTVGPARPHRRVPPPPASQRHQLAELYTDDLSSSQYLSLEESLWTHSAEFSDIALKLSKELKANIKKVQKEIVQAELKERINKLRQQVAAPPIDTEATEPPIEDTSDTRETAVKLTSKRSKLQQLESVLKALEQNDNTALENPACQEIIKLKSETIVNKVKHNVETENREFIAQQHNQRDAQLKTSHVRRWRRRRRRRRIWL